MSCLRLNFEGKKNSRAHTAYRGEETKTKVITESDSIRDTEGEFTHKHTQQERGKDWRAIGWLREKVWDRRFRVRPTHRNTGRGRERERERHKRDPVIFYKIYFKSLSRSRAAVIHRTSWASKWARSERKVERIQYISWGNDTVVTFLLMYVRIIQSGMVGVFDSRLRSALGQMV